MLQVMFAATNKTNLNCNISALTHNTSQSYCSLFNLLLRSVVLMLRIFLHLSLIFLATIFSDGDEEVQEES